MATKRKRGKMVVVFVLVLLCLLWLTRTLMQHFAPNCIAPIPPAPEGTIKVACVGDSIAYGMFLWNRAQNCYPGQLQTLMGDQYAVRNFSANSQTVLKTADRPYIKHNVFTLSTEFEPDMVLIMLGTNDAKAGNWTDVAHFKADYEELVQHYKNLPSNPQVYLITPPSVFCKEGKETVSYGIQHEAMQEISNAVREIAQEEQLPLIDIYRDTAGHPEYFVFIDRVHPNAKGANQIAHFIADAILP